MLRRAYLNALRQHGRLHVFLAQDDDFNSGLMLSKDDIQYKSRFKWLFSLFLIALRRRVVFAINSGEFVGKKSDKKRSTWQVLVASFVRFAGGQVILSGVSIRPGTAVKDTYLRGLAAMSNVVFWRDEATAVEVGLGDFQPDWAFHLGDPNTRRERSHIALSVRGDRPEPTTEWVESVRRFAQKYELKLRVVVQVRRDADAARKLADRLGAKVLDWPADRTHAQHENVVREFYQRCRVIISDRIHALIIAATEGAVPIGIVTLDPLKLERTFKHVATLPLIDARLAHFGDEVWSNAFAEASHINRYLEEARHRLDEVTRRLVRS